MDVQEFSCRRTWSSSSTASWVERSLHPCTPGGEGDCQRGGVDHKDRPGWGTGGEPTAQQGSPLETMLRQLGRGGDHGGWLNESIRTVDLPALPELKEGELGSLVVGDWLQMVTPTMRDLSSVSAQWWEQVTNRAMTANQTWLKAEPVQRLYVRPEVPAECTGSWSRLEQRGQIMLLNALPPQLRAEVLANRATGSVDLIYAVLTHYQPGGLAEKARLLRMLVEPAVPKDLGGLLEGLCGWHRSLRRGGGA